MFSALVVDSDTSCRQLIRATLEAHGIAVREASSVADGLQSFLSQPADIVLTEISSQQLSGFELITGLRRWGNNAPILVLSGGFTAFAEDILQLALGYGANRVLVKPLQPSELWQAVWELLLPVTATTGRIETAGLENIFEDDEAML